jgi:hypothetical protein
VAERKAIAEKPPVDWLSKPYASYLSHAEKRRHLLETLSKYITELGGWLISSPGNKTLRIECRELSEIPVRLAELGYKLRPCGQGTRNIAERIVVTDIFETRLPGR